MINFKDIFTYHNDCFVTENNIRGGEAKDRTPKYVKYTL